MSLTTKVNPLFMSSGANIISGSKDVMTEIDGNGINISGNKRLRGSYYDAVDKQSKKLKHESQTPYTPIQSQIPVVTKPSFYTKKSSFSSSDLSESMASSVLKEVCDKWSPEIEASFIDALRLILKNGTYKIKLLDKNYGRNELISIYIKHKTGEVRTKKQISSHIQVWKKSILNKISNNIPLSEVEAEILRLIEHGVQQSENSVKLFYSIFEDIVDPLSKKSNDLKVSRNSFLMPTQQPNHLSSSPDSSSPLQGQGKLQQHNTFQPTIPKYSTLPLPTNIQHGYTNSSRQLPILPLLSNNSVYNSNGMNAVQQDANSYTTRYSIAPRNNSIYENESLHLLHRNNSSSSSLSSGNMNTNNNSNNSNDRIINNNGSALKDRKISTSQSSNNILETRRFSLFNTIYQNSNPYHMSNNNSLPTDHAKLTLPPVTSMSSYRKSFPIPSSSAGGGNSQQPMYNIMKNNTTE